MKNTARVFLFSGLLFTLGLPAFAADTAPDPSWRKAADNHIYAQKLVNGLMAKYPELVVVGLHLTVPGAKNETMIATNLDRVGKLDDDDDIAVATTHKTVLAPNMTDPHKFEVQVPLKDSAGNFIGGAAGFVFKYNFGDDEVQLHVKALAIRDELAAQTPDAAALLVDAHPTATLIWRSTGWQPGYSGDFDHFGVDVKGNRLFLAAEDHGTLELFNLRTGRHERTLTGFETPHAIIYLPDRNRLIVTDSGKGMTKVLDATTYQTVGHITLEPGADAAEYDASTDHLYIVTGGKDVGMKECFLNEVDPLSGHVYAKLRFDSDHTEAVKAEQHGNRLFVNIADHNYVAVVDKKTLKETARWPLSGAQTNLTMALDEADHRLFVGSRNPSKLFVLNTDTGATVVTLDAPATSDGLFYDSARKCVYLPGGDGYLGVFQQVTPDRYTAQPRISSAIGAKSGIVVPQLNRLYLAASPGEHGKGGEVLWFSLGQ
jgi:DNA-binding beta-propeller fold protein YncE